MLHDLIKALCEYYVSDLTAPSVITSWLSEKKLWYVALHRFNGPFAQGREILFNTVNPDFEEAIKDVSQKFLVLIGRGPAVQHLVEKLA
jgi:hypothetical protein